MDEAEVQQQARQFISPLDLSKVREDDGVYLKRREFRGAKGGARGGESGTTFTKPNGTHIITVNATENQVRQRFTICHEIGHIILTSFPPVMTSSRPGHSSNVTRTRSRAMSLPLSCLCLTDCGSRACQATSPPTRSSNVSLPILVARTLPPHPVTRTSRRCRAHSSHGAWQHPPCRSLGNAQENGCMDLTANHHSRGLGRPRP